MKFCQSCGMPLQAEDQWGMNADGSLNEKYCCYCYQKGAFTQDYTMEEMIGHCLQFLDEFNREADVPRTREQALAEMRQFFPALKRRADEKCWMFVSIIAGVPVCL